MSWTTADIPDQSGRIAIVTGANSGIGFWTAHRLAEAGAMVVLACRNEDKAARAKSQIDSAVGHSHTTILPLDLSRLASVREFVDRFLAAHTRLDLLINNAGVMIPPHELTEDGFELQLGTNHMGHFALTGLLLDPMQNTPQSRIVTVASTAHKMGRINFDDMDSVNRYSAWAAYGQSKLANLLHMLELDRRLRDGGHDIRALAAHPGYTATNLQSQSRFIRMVNPLAGQSADEGALPTLRAAVDPMAQSGSYFGPSKWFELRGPPIEVTRHPRATDTKVAARLWSISESRTGVHYLSEHPPQ